MNVIESIAAMLPGGAAIAGGDLDPIDGFLFPREAALMAGTAARRRRDFTAGRTYARQALTRLGHAPVAILAEPSRAPLWPTGFTGTISHCASCCAAIVARTSDIASVGLDLEDDTPLDADLVSMVCREAELDRRPTMERATRTDLPKLIFVIKEAFYKTYYPLARSFLDFTDVAVAIHPDRFSFDGRLTNAARPSFQGRRQLSGKFGHIETTVFAVCYLRPFQATVDIDFNRNH